LIAHLIVSIDFRFFQEYEKRLKVMQRAHAEECERLYQDVCNPLSSFVDFITCSHRNNEQKKNADLLKRYL
jgi:hypothetical protein